MSIPCDSLIDPLFMCHTALRPSNSAGRAFRF